MNKLITLFVCLLLININIISAPILNYNSFTTNNDNTLPVPSQLIANDESINRNVVTTTNGNYITYYPSPNVKLTMIAFPAPYAGCLGYVAEIDLTNNTTISITPKNPNYVINMTNDVMKSPVLPFMQVNHAIIALDIMFFNFVDNNPYAENVGFAASRGNVISPFTTQPPIDGSGVYKNQAYAIVDNAPAINIDKYNNASLVTRGVSGNTIAQNVNIYNAFAGSALILTNGVACVPTYTTGLTVMNGYSDANSWYNLNTCRSFSAINQAGNKLYLGVIDSTNNTYLTVPLVVSMVLQDYTYLFPNAGDQPYFAINNDGGSSPTFCWVNPINNCPQILNPVGQINQRNNALSIAIGYKNSIPPIVPDNLISYAQSNQIFWPTNSPLPTLPTGYCGPWVSNGYFYYVTAQHPNGILISTP